MNIYGNFQTYLQSGFLINVTFREQVMFLVTVLDIFLCSLKMTLNIQDEKLSSVSVSHEETHKPCPEWSLGLA